MSYRESLPLYRPTPSTLQATPYDSECSRCELKQPKLKCLPPDGEPNGILVIGASIGRIEEANKRQFASSTGLFVRDTLRRFTSEPLAFDSGIRCVGGDVDACRSYTLHTIDTYKPRRIICVSEGAALAVLGRSHGEGAIKRWYGYFNGIPVFVVPDVLRASRNRFLKNEFVADVEWAVSHVPMADPKDLTCAVPASAEETALAVQEATAAGVPVAVDCEWAGNSENANFRLLSIALAVDDKSWVWDEKSVASDRVSAPLRQFFLSSHPKVGHHAKADIRSLWTWLGEPPKNFSIDTRLMWKVQAAECDGDLDSCADMIGMGGHKAEAKKELEKAVKMVRKLAASDNMFDKLPADALDSPKSYAFAYIPRDTLLRYNALDTVATHRLWREMTCRLETQPVLQQTLKRTVMPASLALAQVEKWGVLIDKGALDSYSQFLSQRVAEIRQKLASYGDFNPASGPELADLLYKKLKLKVPFKTDSGKPSTDKDALAEIAKVHPIGADLLEFRKVTKHEGTYAIGLRNCITDDGRIHPFYNTDGAETGRISCLAPWTLVRTSTGDKAIVDIRPGDLVWTHKERWRSVKALLEQGVKYVVNVRFCNGYLLTCTADHRLLGCDGRWRTVQELANERFKELGQQRAESTGSAEYVPERGVADVREDCREAGIDLPKRQAHRSDADSRSRAQGVVRTQVLGFQDRGQEPHEGQDPRQAPQLERRVRRRLRVLNDSLEWQAAVRSSRGDDAALGDYRDSKEHGRTPHRQQPEEQRHRQPCTCNHEGSSLYSLFTGEGQHGCHVEEVYFGGSLPVFDLSVEEDESFFACGIFAHNCSSPNLQNIPRADSDEGKMARNLFVAGQGKVLVQADYSQLELRVAAALSGDEKMLEIFHSGVDYHQRTAEMVSKVAWGISPEQVEKKHRTAAKSINFGLLYGRGDSALAEQMGSTREDAAKVRAAVLGNFRKLAADIEASIRGARQTGEVWTSWDGQPARRRSMVGIADADEGLKAAAERQSYNTRVQGSASDLCLASVAGIVNWINEDCVPAKLVLTVHDSIMVECDKAVQDEVVYQMRRIMESQPCGGVPIVVDVEVGDSWGSLEKLK